MRDTRLKFEKILREGRPYVLARRGRKRGVKELITVFPHTSEAKKKVQLALSKKSPPTNSSVIFQKGANCEEKI